MECNSIVFVLPGKSLEAEGNTRRILAVELLFPCSLSLAHHILMVPTIHPFGRRFFFEIYVLTNDLV